MALVACQGRAYPTVHKIEDFHEQLVGQRCDEVKIRRSRANTIAMATTLLCAAAATKLRLQQNKAEGPKDQGLAVTWQR